MDVLDDVLNNGSSVNMRVTAVGNVLMKESCDLTEALPRGSICGKQGGSGIIYVDSS